MKLFLVIVGIVILAASLFADYKWHQWITARRRERNQSNFPGPR